MLQNLSGSVHQVLAAVSVHSQGHAFSSHPAKRRSLKTLSEAEISAYITSGEPMDKAGAYGIQGLGGVFVADLRGSFTGVMGLPCMKPWRCFAQCGLAVPPFQTA